MNHRIIIITGGILAGIGLFGFIFRKKIMSMLNARSLSNLQGVHPNLCKVMETASATTPIPFTITSGVRTQAQQQALYAKGRTTAGSIVTNADGVTKKSNHQVKADGYAYAVDLFASPNGAVNVNDAASLKTIAAHIKSTAAKLGIAITWGGDFKSFIDYPHFELKT